MSMAACEKNLILDTRMDDIPVDADESLNSIDSDETFSPFCRINVTNILLPPLIKIEDENDHVPPPFRKSRAYTDEERTCTICFQKFSSRLLLVSHCSREHFGARRFKCDICTRKFGHEDIFMTHCRKHNGNKPFYCPLCNTWFHDLADLDSHAQEFQFRAPLHCFVCGQRSARKSKLLLESRSDMIFKKLSKTACTVLYYCEQCQPKDTHDCAICGRIFMQPGFLRQHYNSSHLSVEPFKCRECFASFASRCILERHLEMHPRRQKPWVCHLCGLRFQQQSAHFNHLQDHQSLKPFSCSICGESFHFEERLNLHVANHNIIRENDSSRSTISSITVNYETNHSFIGCKSNDSLVVENETSVNKENCLSNVGEVLNSGRDVQTTSSQVRDESVSSSSIQIELASNVHKLTGNMSVNLGNFVASSVDPLLQKSSPSVFLQHVKQEGLNDGNCAIVQRCRFLDENSSFSSNKITDNLSDNDENTACQGNAMKFSLNRVKKEVLSDDEGQTAIHDDRDVGGNTGSSHTEVNTRVVDNAENCEIKCIKKGFNQNIDSTPFQGCCSLGPSGSTSATVLCNDGNNSNQIESSLNCVKTETVSEKENKIQIMERTAVYKEQHCLEESMSRDVSVAEEEEDEFCPLDILSTEIILNSEEPTFTLNSDSLSEYYNETRILNGDVGSMPSRKLNETSEVITKTGCSDHSISLEELDIKSEIKEESKSSFSCEDHFENGRDEMECESTVSPEPQTCDFGQIADKSYTGQSKQLFTPKTDQKMPINSQLDQYSILPKESVDSVGLVSFQRLPEENNSYHGEVRRHKCCFCNKFMESSISLRQHYRTVHHGEPRHMCRTCHQQFHLRTDLQIHVRHAHRISMYCELCDGKFMKFQALEAHYFKHLSKTPYLCVSCHTWFQDLDELENHRTRARPLEELHYCGYCGCKNAWKFELSQDGKGKLYVCENCKLCLGKKIDTCEGCGRVFRNQALLETHYIREHTGRYQCSNCRLFFDTKCILVAHMETMCGTLKVSMCTACGRQFQDEAALQQHAQVHHSLLHPKQKLR